jgi:hypothetical protein
MAKLAKIDFSMPYLNSIIYHIIQNMDTKLVTYCREVIDTKLVTYCPQVSGKIFKFKPDDNYDYNYNQKTGYLWYEQLIDVRLGCDMCQNGAATSLPINLYKIKDADGYFSLEQLDIECDQLTYDVSLDNYFVTSDKPTIELLRQYKMKLWNDSSDLRCYEYNYYSDPDYPCRFEGKRHEGLSSIFTDDNGDVISSPLTDDIDCHLCSHCYKWFTCFTNTDSKFTVYHPFKWMWESWLDEWTKECEEKLN